MTTQELTAKATEAARKQSAHIVPADIAAKVEAGLVEGDRVAMGPMLAVYEGNDVIRVTRDGAEVFRGPASADQLEDMLVLAAANAGRRGTSMGTL